MSGLGIGYRVRGRVRPTVHDVSFVVPTGSAVALVGESGSGKSTVANVLLRLAAPNAVITAGTADYRGEPLLTAPDRRLRGLRGNEIAYIPQDPANSLNPVRSIGSQLAETLQVTRTPVPQGRRARVIELLAGVGIRNPEQVAGKHPHQLSGGMLQRVLIASAIAARPRLLVADEPTSALDVTVQRRVLDLIDELRSELDLGVLLITHDLALAEERCDHLVVLQHGEVREAGRAAAVLGDPRSDYTRRLRSDIPALNPDRYGRTAGAPSGVIPVGAPSAGARSTVVPAIEIAAVTKVFTRGGAEPLVALDAVDLTVQSGTTHAVVGESGSGKTTLARIVLGLERPTAGQVRVGGQVPPDTDAGRRELRRHLQLVYQNPFVSLDPRYTAQASVAEPLRRYGIGTRAGRDERARELLRLVGLPEATFGALPRRLSGGQRQRVAIARALALEPDVLVLDEPTSALDVSVQAQILQLLVDLQQELGSTYLLISHDLGVVRQLADRVTVLRHGTVVETGPAAAIFHAPQQEYTRDLIESVPGWARLAARAIPA